LSEFFTFLGFKCHQIFFGNRLTFLRLPFSGSFFGQAKNEQKFLHQGKESKNWNSAENSLYLIIKFVI